jgi:hypothetical protein
VRAEVSFWVLGFGIHGWGMRHTKVHHVKHPPLSILADCGVHHPILTRAHSDNSLERRPIVLDKLDALFLLLPELEVSIDRGCEDEIGPASGHFVSASIPRSYSREGQLLRNS